MKHGLGKWFPIPILVIFAILPPATSYPGELRALTPQKLATVKAGPSSQGNLISRARDQALLSIYGPIVVQLSSTGGAVNAVLQGRNLQRITSVAVLRDNRSTNEVAVALGPPSGSGRTMVIRAPTTAGTSAAYTVRVFTGSTYVDVPASVVNIQVVSPRDIVTAATRGERLRGATNPGTQLTPTVLAGGNPSTQNSTSPFGPGRMNQPADQLGKLQDPISKALGKGNIPPPTGGGIADRSGLGGIAKPSSPTGGLGLDGNIPGSNQGDFRTGLSGRKSLGDPRLMDTVTIGTSSIDVSKSSGQQTGVNSIFSYNHTTGETFSEITKIYSDGSSETTVTSKDKNGNTSTETAKTTSPTKTTDTKPTKPDPPPPTTDTKPGPNTGIGRPPTEPPIQDSTPMPEEGGSRPPSTMTREEQAKILQEYQKKRGAGTLMNPGAEPSSGSNVNPMKAPLEQQQPGNLGGNVDPKPEGASSGTGGSSSAPKVDLKQTLIDPGPLDSGTKQAPSLTGTTLKPTRLAPNPDGTGGSAPPR